MRSETNLTEKAEDGAIEVFGKNLQQLLMQPPIAGKVVLGWDPAFRTGCKLAVVDATGKVLDTTVIYPTAPTTEKKIQASKDLLKKIIAKYTLPDLCRKWYCIQRVRAVHRRTVKEIPEKGTVCDRTNEAGASVYSASKLATEEFPKFDVGQRSAAPLQDVCRIRLQSL